MNARNIITAGLLISALSYSTTAFSGCESESFPLRRPGHSIPFVICDENATVEETAKTAAKGAIIAASEAAAVPVAIKAVSVAGVTASTGTPIAALSGAAATKATLAAVGGPVVAALGITATPLVVGGVIVVGIGTAVGVGINWLLFD